MIGHAFIAGLLSGSPGEPVTFDPTDKGPDVALSGGNLTATWSQLSGYQSVRTASAKAVGKFYIELNCGAQVEAGVWRAADYAATGASVSGGATGAIGFNLTGSAAQIAFDLDRKLYWRRSSGADSWNYNPSADPVEGIGGVDISSLTGELYFAVSTSTHLDGPATANFGAAGFAADPPYGYERWTF